MMAYSALGLLLATAVGTVRAQVPTKRHRVAIMTILEPTHRESVRLVHKRPFEARPPSR